MDIAKIFNYVVCIIIGIVVSFGGYKLYEAYQASKKADVEISKRDGIIDTVNNSNKSLIEAAEVKKEGEEITKDIVSQVKDLKNQDLVKETQQDIKDKAAEAQIKTEYDNKIKEAKEQAEKQKLQKEKEKMVSAQRMQTLWDSYCSKEPTDKDCGAS